MTQEKFSREEIEEALRPVASLIGKSEKAQEKLKPGTWQHAMLRDNLKALHIALALMSETCAVTSFTQEDLTQTRRALTDMIARSEKAQVKFPPGTSQHTLQRNRIKALRIADALVEYKLEDGLP